MDAPISSSYSSFLDAWDAICLQRHGDELQALASSLQGGVNFYAMGSCLIISPQQAQRFHDTMLEGWLKRSHSADPPAFA
jgi:hypothetical protein